MFLKLNIFLSALLALLIGLIQVEAANESLPQLNCVINNEGWCVFSDVQLGKDQRRYQLSSSIPNANVEKITFERSTIPVISRDICDAFPNVEILYLVGQNIEEVAVDALEGCLKLWHFQLMQNKIKDLPLDVFKPVPNLRMLFLEERELKIARPEWFTSLSKLEGLYISNTLVDYLPLDALKNNTNLMNLYIYTNNLIDLDEKLLLAQFPKLKEFYYNGNVVSCRRVGEINTALRGAGVTVSTQTFYDGKDRSAYIMSKVDGIDCVDDASWAKKMIEKYAESLKQVPQVDENCQKKIDALNEKLGRLELQRRVIKSFLDEDKKCPV